ncbi:NAD(P)-dependent oxidoreductase [Streptomyces griseus]|uniref:NAD-dependent epimerase/dehydratase family protein n=1 Tax=Streptomyces griseus TaxID=1911 RepID=UPI000568BC4A|nr:NAD(P)-dependent oxidoreductase [Streptomyces griseus]
MSPPVRIVLTGPTGFIGSAVLRELAGRRATDALYVTALGRRTTHGTRAHADDWRYADLADAGSLRGVCDDADVLLHLGGVLGPTPEHCHTVNVLGTAALMEEARAAGVGRTVHLSTAAVYGRGPHRGIDVDEVAPAPVSAASASRLEAEAFALAAGAVVLRPGLVLGEGDRWVVPGLAELVRRVPAVWDGGRARISAVAVEDLARLIVALALDGNEVEPGIHHASHPEPVTTGALLRTLADLDVLPRVTESWPWERCVEALHGTEGRAGERQLSLVALDHWYASEEVWRSAGCAPGPGPLHRLTGAAEWYRSRVR